MSFSLRFETQARKEWDNLDNSVRIALKKKLAKRLTEPHVEADRLSGQLANCYKVKHNATGHRLVYQVLEDEVVVLVLAVAKRERLEAYFRAAERREH